MSNDNGHPIRELIADYLEETGNPTRVIRDAFMVRDIPSDSAKASRAMADAKKKGNYPWRHNAPLNDL